MRVRPLGFEPTKSPKGRGSVCAGPCCWLSRAAATGRASRGRGTMSPSRKGIIVAVLQLALVASLGAKYAIDRARFPRVWAQTVAYDPDLPIRGRYLSVRV